jgi:hypothetical protein
MEALHFNISLGVSTTNRQISGTDTTTNTDSSQNIHPAKTQRFLLGCKKGDRVGFGWLWLALDFLLIFLLYYM